MSRREERSLAEKQAVERYRAQGYEVLLPPPVELLPKEVRPYVPDFIATRGAENIAVEVKSHRGLVEEGADLRHIAEQFRQIPGWRFDLVVHRTPEPLPAPRLLSRCDILKRVRLADRIAQKASDYAAALVILWTVLEAVLRAQIEAAGRGIGPARLAKEAYSAGLVTQKQWELLDRLAALRSQIVHGEVPDRVTARTYRMARDLTGQIIDRIPETPLENGDTE
jgi:hypothetical protein